MWWGRKTIIVLNLKDDMQRSKTKTTTRNTDEIKYAALDPKALNKDIKVFLLINEA